MISLWCLPKFIGLEGFHLAQGLPLGRLAARRIVIGDHGGLSSPTRHPPLLHHERTGSASPFMVSEIGKYNLSSVGSPTVLTANLYSRCRL